MTDDAKLIERLDETLGGITVPDLMHGDNLAITLCTAYDNPDQHADEETGWTPDAISGMETVLAAIRAHYAPAAARLTALTEALREIADRHIPDQPAAYGGNETDWAIRQHTELRRLARAALSGDEGGRG